MIKKLFLIIGGILLVLVGLVAFLLWRLDPEELGQEVIRRVNANLEEVDDEQAEILDLGKNECAASAYAAAQAAEQNGA